jgi:hypothetical protein
MRSALGRLPAPIAEVEAWFVRTQPKLRPNAITRSALSAGSSTCHSAASSKGSDREDRQSQGFCRPSDRTPQQSRLRSHGSLPSAEAFGAIKRANFQPFRASSKSARPTPDRWLHAGCSCALPCSRSDFVRRGSPTWSNTLVTLSSFRGKPSEPAQSFGHLHAPADAGDHHVDHG